MRKMQQSTDLSGLLFPVLKHYGWTLPTPRRGWMTVKCLEHGDTQASCRVNNDIGAAACMACDFKGDVITIIRFYEKQDLSFTDALNIAEGISGGSRTHLRGEHQSGGRVSRGQGNQPGGSGQVPLRFRDRATSR